MNRSERRFQSIIYFVVSQNESGIHSSQQGASSKQVEKPQVVLITFFSAQSSEGVSSLQTNEEQ